MALPDHLVISQQPHPPPTIRENNETHYNGEEIIFEATCDEVNLKREIKRYFVDVGFQAAATGVGGLVFLVYLAACSGPLGCLCAKRVADSWRLLLTRSRIYYTRKHHCCVCRCADMDVYVDLKDIDNIEMQDTLVAKGCCSHTHVPTTVALDLKEGRREEVKFTFTHCSNAEEFVQAVKQQVQATLQ